MLVRTKWMDGKRLGVLLVCLGLTAGGCGHPQASPENLHLIASLRTALSAENPEWLEQNAAIIQQRRGAGEVGEREYEAFQAIIQMAGQGKWDEAEQQAIAFQKAQRPSRG